LGSAVATVPGDGRNCSGGFWLAGDLTLDLFAKFQGPGNLAKDFWRPTGTPHDDGSVAEQSSQRRLLDGDAFDSRQEEFDRAAIGKPGLYDNSFISDGHFRRVALQETKVKKYRSKDEAQESSPIHDAARRRNFSSVPNQTRSNRKRDGYKGQHRGNQRGSQHDDPVKLRLILHGFASDEMLLGVTQKNSLKMHQESGGWEARGE
jgi:hypothetical protein